MLQLSIRSPEADAGRACPITGSSVTIGRNRLNDLCLSDCTVSDFHAELIPDGSGGWVVKDHDSSNGTFVNQKKATSEPVREGDVLRFGGVEVVIETKGDSKSGSAPTQSAPVRQEPSAGLDTGGVTLPTAQIERAMAMQRARERGESGSVAESSRADSAKDGGAERNDAGSMQAAEMYDRLKHALAELDQLKDKHALQTRELEKYQERADLLAEPDPDVTKLRIQIADLKGKLLKRGKGGSEKESREDIESISLEAHEAAIKAVAEEAARAAQRKFTGTLAEERKKLQAEHESQLEEREKQWKEQSEADNSKSEEIDILQKRIAELESDVEKRAGDAAKLKERTESLAERSIEAKRMLRQIEELQTTVEKLQGSDAGRSEEYERLSAERDRQIKRLAERDAELALLKVESEDAVSVAEELRLERDRLRKAGEKATAELEAKDAEIERQQASADELRKKLAELERSSFKGNQEVSEKASELSVQLEESREEFESAQQELKELRRQKAEWRKSADQQEASMGDRAKAIQLLQAQLAENEQKLSESEKRNKTLSSSLAEQKDVAGELRAQLESLSSDSADAIAHIGEARQEVQAVREENESLKAKYGEIDDVRSKVQAIEAEGESLRNEIAKLRSEREEMETESRKLDDKHKSIREELRAKQGELDGVADKIRGAEDEARRKRAGLEADLEELQSQQIVESRNLETLLERCAVAEARAKEAEGLTASVAQRWEKAQADAAKEEARLDGLSRKLRRRKKMIERLKQVGRRERKLKRDIESAKQVLAAAEENKPGRHAPVVPRPWDVDKTVADQQALMEGKLRMEEQLRAKREELKRLDAEIRAGRERGGEQVPEIDPEEFQAVIDRVEKAEITIQRLETEKSSLIDTITTLKTKVAASTGASVPTVSP